MAEFSASPTSTVLEHQLFIRHNALWTTCGTSLFGQIHCEVCSQQRSMLDRINLGITPQKAMAIALSAVVDADTWEMGRRYKS
ncbi:unnamed protein product [Penicillium camemberti]|uniref:Str. FM013 n=1 Tax=Penicillium camemberti (strain FM 013) TaxID=1429867 RepID=A0A0G4PYH3_PENC3|nr:unnamed protein product [Penicillium camemberti]